jgi:hypothetical protein
MQLQQKTLQSEHHYLHGAQAVKAKATGKNVVL